MMVVRVGQDGREKPQEALLAGVLREAELVWVDLEIEELRARCQLHEVLDVDGCASLLKISPRTIKRRVRERRIPFVKLGGNKNIRFIRADILSWLRRGAPASRKSRLGPFKSGPPCHAAPHPKKMGCS